MYLFFAGANFVKIYITINLLLNYNTSINYILYTILIKSIFVLVCLSGFLIFKQIILTPRSVHFYRNCVSLLSGYALVKYKNKNDDKSV